MIASKGPNDKRTARGSIRPCQRRRNQNGVTANLGFILKAQDEPCPINEFILMVSLPNDGQQELQGSGTSVQEDA